MEEILHHLGRIKPCTAYTWISTGAGFIPNSSSASALAFFVDSPCFADTLWILLQLKAPAATPSAEIAGWEIYSNEVLFEDEIILGDETYVQYVFFILQL